MKNTFDIIVKEFQTLITISYILAVGIGMLFNFKKYDEFGINIFDYADIFFFLIAPFADLKILGFTVISVLLTYIIFKLDFSLKSKYPRFYSKLNFGMDAKNWFPIFRHVSMFALFLLYLTIAAELYGQLTKENILNQPTISIKYFDNEIEKGILIGKTNEVVFLYTEQEVKVVPTTALVKEIGI